MDEDSRCCGSGTCLINADGLCWCGQRWDGTQMCLPPGDVGEQTHRSSADKPQATGLPEPKNPTAQGVTFVTISGN